MSSIYVNIDSSELDDRDIVNEVTSRWFSERDRTTMIESLISDDSKVSFFLKVKEKFTLTELENLLNPKEVITVSENQIPLFKTP